MIKKFFVALTLSLVLVMGVFAVVKTTQAQSIVDESTPVTTSTTVEDTTVTQSTTDDDDDDIVYPIRTQLRDLQDGECVADYDPQRIRAFDGEAVQGTMQQQRLNLVDGTCDGTCDGSQPLQAGAGNQGAGMQQRQNLADGACDGTYTPIYDGVQLRQGFGGNGR